MIFDGDKRPDIVRLFLCTNFNYYEYSEVILSLMQVYVLLVTKIKGKKEIIL